MHSPLNVDNSALQILYMLKQLLSSSLLEVMKPGCPGNVESGETWLSWLYPQSIGSQCKIKDQIYCVWSLGAMKVTPSDPLHQEYLTINLGSTSDWRQLKLPLVRLFGRWRGRCWPNLSGGFACLGCANSNSNSNFFTRDGAGQEEQPGAENAGGGAVCCYLTFQTLLQLVRMAHP